MTIKICRLCLQTISGNYKAIEQFLGNTLKLNMDISKEPVQCIECANNLEIFLKFKSACDYMREQILTTDLKDSISLYPEKIVTTGNLISPVESNNKIKCCFCTKTSRREGLISLNESKEHMFLVNVLKDHIPKLNLNITEELLTCETCLDGLQSVSSFLMTCLDVEQKISRYIENKGADEKGQIELENIQKFIFKPAIKFEIDSINDLKERYDQSQENYIIQAEAEMKYEDEVDESELLFVKSENVDDELEHRDCNSIQEPAPIFEVDNGSLNISVLALQGELTESVNQTYKNSEGATVYKCEICLYEAKRPDHLKRHKLIHTTTSEIKMFKCELCLYETKRRDHLKRHKLIHTTTSKVKMFKCELCSYETKFAQHLKQHKLVHKISANITMFKCDLCLYQAKRQGHLKRHKLIHTSTSELKMFKCEFCSYEAKRQDTLKQHILIHKSTSEIMFKCELCPYKATCRDYLKRHELTHKSASELTMFKCELCSYEAKRMKNLKQHKLTHKSTSELKMFKCEFCSYESKRRGDLKQHMLTHKPMIKWVYG